MIHLKTIVAVDKNWGIGKDGKLLFHIPEDIKFFREKTINNAVIMGRKTFDSIAAPLDNRVNIIVSSKKDKFKYRGVNKTMTFVYSMDDVKYFLSLNKKKDYNVYIIGGESIYKEFYDQSEEIFVTMVDKEFEADRFFPNLYNTDFKLTDVIKEGDYKELHYKITRWSK